MFQTMKDYWWLLLLRGIVAVVFGIYTLVYPGVSAISLVLAFGIYAVVYGGIAVGMALFGSGNSNDRFILGLQGVVQALLGVLVLAWPGISTLSLLWAIIIFAFVGGIIEIIAAFTYRDFWLGLSGVIGVLFGIYGFRFPADDTLAVVYGIGFYAISIGVMAVIGSFQVRKIGNELTSQPVHAN